MTTMFRYPVFPHLQGERNMQRIVFVFFFSKILSYFIFFFCDLRFVLRKLFSLVLDFFQMVYLCFNVLLGFLLNQFFSLNARE